MKLCSFLCSIVKLFWSNYTLKLCFEQSIQHKTAKNWWKRYEEVRGGQSECTSKTNLTGCQPKTRNVKMSTKVVRECMATFIHFDIPSFWLELCRVCIYVCTQDDTIFWVLNKKATLLNVLRQNNFFTLLVSEETYDGNWSKTRA